MEYWIWLSQIDGVGPVIEKRLLAYFVTPKAIYQATEDELLNVEGIGVKLAKTINTSKSLSKAYGILEECRKKDIKLLTYDDWLYPIEAKEYKEAPILLYYRGELKVNNEAIGMIGSRRTTEYGKRIALETGESLGQNNITVISGMAKGIDGYAHTGAIKGGGHTLAFLGNGVDICYPSEHRGLMDKIIDNGAVISQYPPGTKAKAQFFPKRNGLIASWSKKLLVVEAADKSGSLITAEIAKKLGRKIFAVPHNIYSTTGVGSNKLILEGGTPYLNKDQLLSKEYEGIKDNQLSIDTSKSKKAPKPKKESEQINFTDTEAKIINSLKETPKTIEEISMVIKIGQQEIVEIISIMELESKIISLPGGRYLSN